MKLSWLWRVLLIIGIVAGAYLLQDLVRDYLLTPVVFAYRILRLLVNALPQGIFWALFVIIGVLIALNSLYLKTQTSREVSKSREKVESRAWQFSKWITGAPKSEYSRWMLARQLSALACEVLMYRQRLSADEVAIYVRRNQGKIPAKVRDYILAGIEVPSFRHYSEMAQQLRRDFKDSPLDLDPEVVIAYLENCIQPGGFN